MGSWVGKVFLVILAVFLILGVIFVYQQSAFLIVPKKVVTQNIFYSDFNFSKEITFSNQRTEEYSFDLKNPQVVFVLVPKSVAASVSQITFGGDFDGEILLDDPIILFRPKDFSPGKKVFRIATPVGDKNQTSLVFAFPLAEYNQLTVQDKNLLKQTVIDVSLRAEQNYSVYASNKVMQDYADGLRRGIVGQEKFVNELVRVNFAEQVRLVDRAISSMNNAVKDYPKTTTSVSTSTNTPDVKVSFDKLSFNYYIPDDDIVLTFTSNVDLSAYGLLFKVKGSNSPGWLVTNKQDIKKGQTVKVSLSLAYAKVTGIKPGQKIVFKMIKRTFGGVHDSNLVMLYGKNIVNEMEFTVTGEEALQVTSWPKKIELGVTSLNLMGRVDTNIEYPLDLRSDDEIGKSIDLPVIENNPNIFGINLSVMPGPNGKEPHLLVVQADYVQLIKNNPSLPQTIEFNLTLNYTFLKKPEPIKVKINLNKSGVVLAPLSLKVAADYVSQIKGWKEILIDDSNALGEKTLVMIGKSAKDKIVEEYNANPFTYLQILGDHEQIPIQERQLFDNPNNDEDAPVLDLHYYADVDGDKFPDLAVARIPLNDSLKIINYFNIEKKALLSKIAIVVYPDDTLGTLAATEKDIKELQDKKEPVPKWLLERRDRVLKNLELKGNDKGIMRVDSIEENLALYPYTYEIRYSGDSIEHSDENILFFVNPTEKELNSIINNNDWVSVYSHGVSQGFFDTWHATCIRINLGGKNHPFLTGNACTTSSELGKNLILEGALMYNGNYYEAGVMPLSLFSLAPDRGIGEALTDVQNSSENLTHATILYGDPSITYPTKSSIMTVRQNKIIFSQVKPEFILSAYALSNPAAYFNKANSEITPKLRVFAELLDGTKYYTEKFSVIDSEKNILFTNNTLPTNEFQKAKFYLGVEDANSKVEVFQFKPYLEFVVPNSILVNNPLLSGRNVHFTINPIFGDESLEAIKFTSNFTMDSVYSKFFNTYENSLSDYLTFNKTGNNLIFVERLGAGEKINVGGEYSGPPFETIKKMILRVKDKQLVVSGGNTGGSKKYVHLDLNVGVKKFLYDNGVLQNGFSIELVQ